MDSIRVSYYFAEGITYSTYFWRTLLKLLLSIAPGSDLRSCSLEGLTSSFHLDVSQHRSCAGIDWAALFLLWVVVHSISWWPRWIPYEPFANWLRKSHSGWTKETSERFSQSVTAGLFNIIRGVLAWKVLREKDWLWNVHEWSENTQTDTSASTSWSVEADFKLYYLLYAARYLFDLISLLYEHRRSGTFAYAIHHVITSGLVLLSAHTGYTRIGGVIMFFFDWADPPMMIAKAFLYLSLRPDDIYQQIADLCMGIFAFNFVLTRNIIFILIFFICICEFLHSTQEIIALKAMLVVLGLMTFWLGLIIKAIYNQYFRNDGHIDDIREKKSNRTVVTNKDKLV